MFSIKLTRMDGAEQLFAGCTKVRLIPPGDIETRKFTLAFTGSDGIDYTYDEGLAYVMNAQGSTISRHDLDQQNRDLAESRTADFVVGKKHRLEQPGEMRCIDCNASKEDMDQGRPCTLDPARLAQWRGSVANQK